MRCKYCGVKLEEDPTGMWLDKNVDCPWLAHPPDDCVKEEKE